MFIVKVTYLIPDSTLLVEIETIRTYIFLLTRNKLLYISPLKIWTSEDDEVIESSFCLGFVFDKFLTHDVIDFEKWLSVDDRFGKYDG